MTTYTPQTVAGNVYVAVRDDELTFVGELAGPFDTDGEALGWINDQTRHSSLPWRIEPMEQYGEVE